MCIYIYMYIWLLYFSVWFCMSVCVCVCVFVCVCLSGDSVKECIHSHKVVRVCQQQKICVKVLADLSHAALLFCLLYF